MTGSGIFYRYTNKNFLIAFPGNELGPSLSFK